MEELSINLVVIPARSKTRKAVGIITILIAISWLTANIIYKGTLSLFDIVYSLFFSIYGIFFTLDGAGISAKSWFGESYIRINTEGLYIKKSVFKKEWVLLWNDIEQVEITVIKIKFTLSDKTHKELDYDNLEFEHIQKIKQTINSLAKEKNIRLLKSF
jgi:hypothetical protein